MKREMGVDREGGGGAVSNQGLPWMDPSCLLLLCRSSECGCSGVRAGWFMSCFWLRTDVESCQVDCCLIILVWRVRHCDRDYTHSHTRTSLRAKTDIAALSDGQTGRLQKIQTKIQTERQRIPNTETPKV